MFGLHIRCRAVCQASQSLDRAWCTFSLQIRELCALASGKENQGLQNISCGLRANFYVVKRLITPCAPSLWSVRSFFLKKVTLQAINWFPESEYSLLLMFSRWSIIMSYALKASLRGQNPTPELQRLLPQSELELASNAPHLPNLVAMVGRSHHCCSNLSRSR